VNLKRSNRNTVFSASLTFEPLGNLPFTRDQQIVTKKGIVIGRMNSEQRKLETKIMKFFFEKLQLKVIGEIPDSCKLEGGDFFPAGDDLCFIGVGLRSDEGAVKYMLDNDLFGTNRVAVER